MNRTVHLRFAEIQTSSDEPPQLVFVEAEDQEGVSFRLGEWEQDGVYSILVFDDPRRVAKLEADLKETRGQLARLRQELNTAIQKSYAP